MENEDESGYSYDEKNGFSRVQLIPLYKRYHESMHEALTRHFNVRNYYTVLLTASFGFFITMFIQLIDKLIVSPILYWILGLILVEIFIMSVFAIMSTSRYYTGFLRYVVLVAKIENLLRLDKAIKTKESGKAIIDGHFGPLFSSLY